MYLIGGKEHWKKCDPTIQFLCVLLRPQEPKFQATLKKGRAIEDKNVFVKDNNCHQRRCKFLHCVNNVSVVLTNRYGGYINVRLVLHCVKKKKLSYTSTAIAIQKLGKRVGRTKHRSTHTSKIVTLFHWKTAKIVCNHQQV